MANLKIPGNQSEEEHTLDNQELGSPSFFFESPIQFASKSNLSYSPSNDFLSSVTSPKTQDLPLTTELMAKQLHEAINQHKVAFSRKCDKIKQEIQSLLSEDGKENIFRAPEKD
ncbi:unnamed protein product [Blepharisma stoltei]|uniref:Uncharacterized protein n=1 Tax=Blepharisma stoltei TaxID=1481888 RepID=A0AAU9J696_9CILI|nr:unnamed protein product [Blepharisma stoltei]